MYLHVKTLNRRNDQRKKTHARIHSRQTGGVRRQRTDGSSVLACLLESRGGTDRFTGSLGPLPSRLHTSAHLGGSFTNLVRVDDSVPRQTLVCVSVRSGF